jgi:hypothetical protein
MLGSGDVCFNQNHIQGYEDYSVGGIMDGLSMSDVPQSPVVLLPLLCDTTSSSSRRPRW